VSFQKYRPFGFFALAADTTYRFTASTLDFEPSWVATPKTYVTFSGHARGDPVDVPFHVTSHDWQNSDRLFAAIMTNFGSQMGAIEVGGRGTFDGRLTRAFKAPRIEGRFAGDAMRAWKVVWGSVEGDIAIENNYLALTNGRIDTRGGGFRRPAAAWLSARRWREIDAAVTVENMPLEPLKRAFGLDDWPARSPRRRCTSPACTSRARPAAGHAAHRERHLGGAFDTVKASCCSGDGSLGSARWNGEGGRPHHGRRLGQLGGESLLVSRPERGSGIPIDS
jgi:hypothetical protein